MYVVYSEQRRMYNKNCDYLLLVQNADDRPQFKVLSSSLGEMNAQQDDDYSETVDD